LADLAAALGGTWTRWDPGYLLLTVDLLEGLSCSPLLIDTSDEETTISFGKWHAHVGPGTIETDDEEELADATASEVQAVADGLLDGMLVVLDAFDFQACWKGSTLVEVGAHETEAERLRASLAAHVEAPARIEVRSPRRALCRAFAVVDGVLREVPSDGV
jgi:hypothetical protein